MFLADLGQLHLGRKKVQPAGREIKQFHDQAADLLRHPLLSFDEPARAEIATAFADTMAQKQYTCYACAIMPDHIHILIRKHKHQAEEMMNRLKEASRAQLIAQKHRSVIHPTWTDGSGWKVFLEHPDEVRRTIRYIDQNPLAISLPAQFWSFVQSYDGWPLHPGHSPNSPYVRRLRAAGRYP